MRAKERITFTAASIVTLLAFAWLTTRRGAPSAGGLMNHDTPPPAHAQRLSGDLGPVSARRSGASPVERAAGAAPPTDRVHAAPDGPLPYRVRARLVDREGVGIPGLVVTVEDEPLLGVAQSDTGGVLDGFPCADAAPRVLAVRFSDVPRAHYGDEALVTVTPTEASESLPEVEVPHGPRVYVDTLPPGTRALDFAVEVLHDPSPLSSQIGRLGGCSQLRDGPRGPWAWAPPITNGVRGKGAHARVLARDGLWASASVLALDRFGQPIARRIEAEDEVFVRSTFHPTGVVHLRIAPPFAGTEVMLRRSGPVRSAHDTPLEVFVALGSTDGQGVQRFHWLSPGTWSIGPSSGTATTSPDAVVVRPGAIVDVDVTLHAQ